METANSLSWLIGVAGLLEILAAFILDYSTTPLAMWHATIAGVAVIVLTGWVALSEQVRLDQNLAWVKAVVIGNISEKD